jgi:hypothetical protein
VGDSQWDFRPAEDAMKKTLNLNPVDNYLAGSWEALGNGAPVLVALAQLCSDTWVRQGQVRGSPAQRPAGSDSEAAEPVEVLRQELSGEAQAILFAARHRGVIELKAVNTAFDAAARLLAVYVEESEERTIAFRDSQRPEVTVLFLDGFRELCATGLVLHHIYRDFSLSPLGFEVARTIAASQVQKWLDMATEFGLHD